MSILSVDQLKQFSPSLMVGGTFNFSIYHTSEYCFWVIIKVYSPPRIEVQLIYILKMFIAPLMPKTLISSKGCLWHN